MDEDRFFILNRGDLEDRFDSFFYKPIFRKLVSTLNNGVPILQIAKYVIHPPEFKRIYSQIGPQLIRSQNIRPTGVDLSNSPVYLAEEALKNKRIITAKKGDVLIVRSGVNAGDIAVVEEDDDNSIVGADTLLARIDQEIVLPKFVQVFYWTNIGKKILSRYITGATNTHLSPYSFNRTIIAVPGIDKQKETITRFENSLKEKESKEAQAAKLLESIDDYLLSELGITLPPEPDNTIENRTFKTTFTKVSGNRLDPFFNRPELFESQLAVERGHFKTIRIREVCSLVRGVTYSQMDECPIETDIRILRANNIDLLTNELNFSSIRFLRNDFRISELNKLKRNDILMSIASGSKDHVGKVAFIENDMPYYFGGFMAVLRMKQLQFSPKFLFYFLQSKAFRRVLFRHLGGTNINNLNYSMISGINLPHPDYSTQLKLIEVLDSLRERYLTLKREAKADFELAKKEIEKLILNPE